MSYGNTSYFYAHRISCLNKNIDNNEVILHVYDVSKLKRKNRCIKFTIYWKKDTPEKLLEELKRDAGIIITNPTEFIKLISIFHKPKPQITTVQDIDVSSSVS